MVSKGRRGCHSRRKGTGGKEEGKGDSFRNRRATRGNKVEVVVLAHNLHSYGVQGKRRREHLSIGRVPAKRGERN